MTKLLVTGATGLLGSTLVPLLQERGHQVTQMSHNHTSDLKVDLTIYEHTAYALDHIKPEVIINLAALTDVDRCETNPQEAYLLNVKSVENICSWVKREIQPCHFIQISTDQVYDGPGPHAEEDLSICNYYAMSKLAGEFVAKSVPSSVLRTNFVGYSKCKGRSSLTDWLHLALLGESEVNVFDDVLFSPLAITTLSECIELCVIKKPLGVFNLGSRDGMSKANFAFEFATALNLSTSNLVRTSASNVSNLIAQRPNDMRMNSQRFECIMNLSLPSLTDEVKKIASYYR
tara:strand:+ start:541 stop:1407 length:867 start_codon:yes stop_codon:yes gene_type:complete